MFGVVYKKVTFFEINYENCQFKFASFCVQDQPVLKIKILDQHRTCFDAINQMIVSES